MRASPCQNSLFEAEGPRQLVVDSEGGVVYEPGLVDASTAIRWFEALRDEVPWQAQKRPMYDRIVDVPRLTAGYRLDSERISCSSLSCAWSAALARVSGWRRSRWVMDPSLSIGKRKPVAK
jgi:alkylated DNA repair dioxygenase AlkB